MQEQATNSGTFWSLWLLQFKCFFLKIAALALAKGSDPFQSTHLWQKGLTLFKVHILL
jgi:hypothetical protein